MESLQGHLRADHEWKLAPDYWWAHGVSPRGTDNGFLWASDSFGLRVEGGLQSAHASCSAVRLSSIYVIHGSVSAIRGVWHSDAANRDRFLYVAVLSGGLHLSSTVGCSVVDAGSAVLLSPGNAEVYFRVDEGADLIAMSFDQEDAAMAGVRDAPEIRRVPDSPVLHASLSFLESLVLAQQPSGPQAAVLLGRLCSDMAKAILSEMHA